MLSDFTHCDVFSIYLRNDRFRTAINKHQGEKNDKERVLKIFVGYTIVVQLS
jgi:hypothetical protein